MSLPTHDTTNYVESIFRIHEDKTFQWHKAYNLVNTLNVLIEEDSLYFKNKLVALTMLQNTPKYKFDNVKIEMDQICDIGDGVYRMDSESHPDTIYTLNVNWVLLM